MREEIRRERTVELALEGFRYDDLIRWKTAEIRIAKRIAGRKIHCGRMARHQSKYLKPECRQVLIVEPASTRRFQANRDYLYPVPLNEISLSGGNVIQNPNWQ